MLSAKQIPKDGVGREKTLYGRGVRLKAKNLSKISSTTLKITGMTSGAVQYIDIVVKNGTPARFSPPSATPPLGKLNNKLNKDENKDENKDKK
jgi:hypothetical protein